MKRYHFWLILLLIALAVIYGAWFYSSHFLSETQLAMASEKKGQGTPTVGGAFELIDHTGQRRIDKDFRGKFMMVYFGYRYCPDICPTALSTMTEALELLGAKANHIQPLFITVDPERDQREELAEYMQNFHPSFLGLTGSKEQIENARKAYRVFAVRAEEDRGSSDYLIDHSSIIYVMDRQGKLIAHFNHSTPPDQIAAALWKVL